VSTANYFPSDPNYEYGFEYTYIVQYSPRIHAKSLSYGNNSVRSAAVICGWMGNISKIWIQLKKQSQIIDWEVTI